MSLRGSGSAKKGGGLSGLNTSLYGFYVTKFRTATLTTELKTATSDFFWLCPKFLIFRAPLSESLLTGKKRNFLENLVCFYFLTKNHDL